MFPFTAGDSLTIGNTELLITALFCPIIHDNKHWGVSFDLYFDHCNVLHSVQTHWSSPKHKTTINISRNEPVSIKEVCSVVSLKDLDNNGKIKVVIGNENEAEDVFWL